MGPRTFGVLIILAILAAAVGYHYTIVGLLKHDITKKDAKISTMTVQATQLTARVQSLEAESKGCQEALDRQNTQVKILTDSIANASKISRQAIEQANADKIKWANAFKNVLSMPKKPEGIMPGEVVDPGPMCEAFDQRLRMYINIRQGGGT